MVIYQRACKTQNYFHSFNAGSPYTPIQSYSTPSSKLNTIIIEGRIVIMKHHLPKFRNIRFAARLENSVNMNITIPTHTIILPISSKPPSVSSNPLPRIIRFILVNFLFRTSMAIYFCLSIIFSFLSAFIKVTSC